MGSVDTIVGVVLAGGSGRRMGGPKASLELDGTTLAARAASVLRPLSDLVLVSVSPGAPVAVAGIPAVEDDPPAGRGPLAGLRASYARAGTADLLVLACDYPFVSGPLLRAVLSAARAGDDVVFPSEQSGRDHPLVGLWRRSAEAAVADALARDSLSVRGVLGSLRVRRFRQADNPGLDLAHLLANWNTPEDRNSG